MMTVKKEVLHKTSGIIRENKKETIFYFIFSLILNNKKNMNT